MIDISKGVVALLHRYSDTNWQHVLVGKGAYCGFVLQTHRATTLDTVHSEAYESGQIGLSPRIPP